MLPVRRLRHPSRRIPMESKIFCTCRVWTPTIKWPCAIFYMVRCQLNTVKSKYGTRWNLVSYPMFPIQTGKLGYLEKPLNRNNFTFPQKEHLGGVMVSKMDKQAFTSELDSHWVPHSFGLVPHLSKKLSKLLPFHKRNRHLKLLIFLPNSFAARESPKYT